MLPAENEGAVLSDVLSSLIRSASLNTTAFHTISCQYWKENETYGERQILKAFCRSETASTSERQQNCIFGKQQKRNGCIMGSSMGEEEIVITGNEHLEENRNILEVVQWCLFVRVNKHYCSAI